MVPDPKHRDPPVPSGSPPDLEDLLARCRRSGMRVTRLLRAVLRFLLGREDPVRIQQAAADPSLRDCDPATLYRLFARLEENGLVRQIGMHGRSAWFGLADSLRHRHYLCCRACGLVLPLPGECALAETQERIARENGFTEINHELTFYGLCPDCAAKRRAG